MDLGTEFPLDSVVELGTEFLLDVLRLESVVVDEAHAQGGDCMQFTKFLPKQKTI